MCVSGGPGQEECTIPEGREASGRPPVESLGELTYQPERKVSIMGTGREHPWMKTEDPGTTSQTS